MVSDNSEGNGGNLGMQWDIMMVEVIPRYSVSSGKTGAKFESNLNFLY